MEIEFGNLELNERFFDPQSGDYWIKTGKYCAKIDSGTDSAGEESFEIDELVIV